MSLQLTKRRRFLLFVFGIIVFIVAYYIGAILVKINQHYKRVIRKLQDNLRKPITQFIIYDAIIWGLYKLNPELFKEDVNNELVEKAIIKTTAILEGRMRFDLRPNMAVELMRRDKALGML